MDASTVLDAADARADANTTAVLDHGFVRLDACMADDLSVVNAARVSFGKRRHEMADADVGLVKFLIRERHGTPFEHNAFRFHIRCPLFVAREWFRHRIGSFNEESARYHEMEPVFYRPEPSAVRQQVGKPGAYSFEPIEGELADEIPAAIAASHERAFADYRRMIDQGVAKELARSVLPVGLYTQFYWTVNARSLMNFLSLRASEHAQYEIRVYADALERYLAQAMPVTHEAFIGNGRVAP